MSLKRANILNEYKKNPDLKKEDVESILGWLKMQPHLPSIDELQVILFLNACYYSNEATKRCIDNFYTIRTHCPEFFANRNPKSKQLKEGLDISLHCPLPKLSPEGYTIFYNSFINNNPDFFVFNTTLKLFDMVASLHLQEYGTSNGHIIIVDLEGCTLTHVMKLGLLSMKKYLIYLQDAIPFRLKGFHFVNAVPFMDKIMAIMKPFMKKELMDMLQIHTSPNTNLFNSIPKECLPQESGGSCGPIKNIFDDYRKNINENVKFFVEEETLVVDESRRPGKPKNAGDLFGVEGTFKKLDID
ncbi:PREDICTED: alpha-tocopherol transfer protein-like [Nicrophorus vespilloides]|uniref:Alpha-tocopherol transfer protein-like n=1 Tax=Nicrophorus vespilloides TaxID=110193 RepID=A0ABM1N3B8_NICVS|nr:PREDICTED: alpha-tocopherol transfer protein-like [Nicrophorus vespilloides]